MNKYFLLFIASESLQNVSLNMFHTLVIIIHNKNSQTQMN